MKLIAIILSVTTIVVFQSCSKLEIYPVDQITNREEFYADKKNLKNLLAGVYNPLGSEYIYGSVLSIYINVGTDEATSRLGGAFYNYAYHPHSITIERLWGALYSGVNCSNEFLYYLRFARNLTDEERDNYKAQVRFLRAWYYFNLVRLFGDVPLRKDFLKDTDQTNISRTKAMEVYDFIIEDLLFTSQKGLEPGNSLLSSGMINRTAARCALAEVYLTLAGANMYNRIDKDYKYFSSDRKKLFEKTLAYCDQVITEGYYGLRENYVQYFINQVNDVFNKTSSIFEIQFKYLRDEGHNEHSRIGKWNGILADNIEITGARGYCYATGYLSRHYEDGDVRKWNVPNFKYGKNGEEKIIEEENTRFPGKWRFALCENETEKTDRNFGGADLSIYRMATVYLMRAEALMQLGRLNEAIDVLNEIRKASNASALALGLDFETVKDLLQREYMLEAAFEGRRKFDLIRWGNLEEKVKLIYRDYLGSNINFDYYSTRNLLLPGRNFDASKHTIFPIPQREITLNNSISQDDQNQGWGGQRPWK